MIRRFFANYADRSHAKLATIIRVWRRIHILGPVQSFVLGSICAAVIALPLAVQTVSRDETSILRGLFWPQQLDPFIVFPAFFLGVLPLLLGYFHLGRVGFILSLGLGIPLPWLMALSAVLCFLRLPMWLGMLSYTGCVLLVYMLMFWLHMKAIKSPSVRDAQRKMRLATASSS